MTHVRWRKQMISVLVTVTAVIIGLIIVFPVFYTFATAFKARSELTAYPPTVLPDHFTLENFKTALERAPLFRFMLNSLIMGLLGTFLRVTFAVLAAYVFAYYQFPGSNVLFLVVMGTMMLPGDTLLMTNYLTVSKLGLMDNYLGMCITSLVGASQMFMLRNHFKTLPRSLRDAAFLDGCGDLRYLFSVVLPLSRPVIMTLSVQSFMTFWNAFLWPLLVTNKTEMRTVQVGISMLTTPLDTNYTLVLAGVSIILIPSFILFIILRMNIKQGLTAGSIVG